MKKTLIVFAFVLIGAGSASAQVSSAHAQWGESAVKWLMTRDELKQWKGLRTDGEAERFIALFWARRDPTLATARNEFQEEFTIREALADRSFTTTKIRGSLSDRGRAVILLGSPFTVTTQGGTGKAASNTPVNPGNVGGADGSLSVGGARGARPMIVWTYASDKKPAFVKRNDFQIMFSDEQGGGEYEFAITPRSNPESFMGDAVKAYLVNASLTEVPAYTDATVAPASNSVSTAPSFKNSVFKEAVDAARAAKNNVGSARLTWGEFVTPAGERFVPVSLYVPAGSGVSAGAPATFFGAIYNETGALIQVHEQDMTLAASGKDAYFDKSLTLDPGNYTATFGVAADGKPVSVVNTELKVSGLDPAEPAVSQLILTNNAFPLPQAQHLTDPFAFGGLKVVPKGDASFTKADDFTYFFEIRNPGLDETGAPKLMAKLDLTGKTVDQKPVSFNFPMSAIEAQALKGVKGHYGVIQAFALADFKPGEYSIKMRVRDTVLQKNYDFERQFTIAP